MRQCRYLEMSSDPRLKKLYRYRPLRADPTRLEFSPAAEKHLFSTSAARSLYSGPAQRQTNYNSNQFSVRTGAYTILPQVHNYAKVLFIQKILMVWTKQQTLILVAAL